MVELRADDAIPGRTEDTQDIELRFDSSVDTLTYERLSEAVDKMVISPRRTEEGIARPIQMVNPVHAVITLCWDRTEWHSSTMRGGPWLG